MVWLPTQHAHRQRLRLVGGMMAQQKMQNPGFPAGMEQPGSASILRPFCQGRALRQPGKWQQARWDAKAARRFDGELALPPRMLAASP